MALLEIEGLFKSFGEAEILRDINLKVEEGEVLALIGPTGSGKTTLLRLIDLLDEPTAGHIFFREVDICHLPSREKLKARRRMAMVFQKPAMFSSSVLENVSYGLKVRGKDDQEMVKRVLSSVGLEGYDHRDASTLSGGEMQRIALARAIIIEPELLLLDEPTANLDPRSSSSIEEIISGLSKHHTTVILATHNMEQCLRLADRVAVLMEGRLAKIAEPKDIFAEYEKKGTASIISTELQAPW